MKSSGILLSITMAMLAVAGTACGQAAAPAAASPPDISGIWGGRVTPSLADAPPLLPDAAKLFEKRTPEEDPLAICKPPGIPRLMDLAFQFEIVQTPKVVYFLMEYGQHVRRIYINGTHPADLDPTWFGHSIGHWEGRTLVVDTIGFNDQSWLDMRGHPHGEKLHVVERYTLADDGKSLKREATIDDPEMYSKPWETVTKSYPRSQGAMQEYICETG